MKHTALCLICALAVSPAQAQDSDTEDLMRRGLEMFLEGMQDELSPTMRALADLAAQAGPALQGFVEEMGPALADIVGQVQDWTAYHPPEILPNGDIILRRKQPGELELPEGGELPPAEDGQIDL